MDTLADYQQVLRTVTYQDQMANPDTSAVRNVFFVAKDGTSQSSTATTYVTVSMAPPWPPAAPSSRRAAHRCTVGR